MVQGGAYRPIHDCSEHGQHTTSGTVKSVDLAGIDEIAGSPVHLFRIRSQDNEVWEAVDSKNLVIGTVGTAKAFRQLQVVAV